MTVRMENSDICYLEDKKQLHLDFYYCPNCHEIPKQTFNKEFKIEIECDKCEDKKILEPEEFAEEIKRVKKTTECFAARECGNKHAKYYCTNCALWMCTSCYYTHSDSMKDHNILKSDGLLMTSICEEENCKYGVLFYCPQCQKHICSTCKDKYHKDHPDATQISGSVNDNIIDEIRKEIAYSEEIEATEKQQLENFITALESSENQNENKTESQSMSIDYLSEKTKESEYIKMFLNNLVNAYISTKHVPNYPVRDNLKNYKNCMDYIKEYKLKRLRAITDLVKGFTIISFFPQLLDNSFDAIYEIENTVKPTYLFEAFYNEFNKKNCEMYLDEEKTSFDISKVISKDKEHKLRIKMKEGKRISNMNMMFKETPISFFISFLDTSNVWTMAYIFCGCTKLKFVDISNMNTTNVKDMSGLFCGCVNLEEIALGSIDTSSVTDMNRMFKQCSSLKFVDISRFNTKYVKDMSRLFFGCKSLIEVKFGEYNTSALTDISFMFFQCESLTSIDLSTFNTASVGKFSFMFKGCTNLKEVKTSEQFIISPGSDIVEMSLPKSKK
ncbi:MAG: DUF285 domain-containing protein [archaeon]|nr:DUF285 domain-containing protein [archaeon]